MLKCVTQRSDREQMRYMVYLVHGIRPALIIHVSPIDIQILVMCGTFDTLSYS